MRKYSVFAVVREAMRAHKGWEAQWVSPEPRQSYDFILIGAGGHAKVGPAARSSAKRSSASSRMATPSPWKALPT